MLFYLMISIMVLFTVYHFYIDVKGKLNTGNTFAEGMTNSNQLAEYMGAKGGYDFASRDEAKAKCEGEGLQLCSKEEVIAGAKSKSSLQNVCSTGWTKDAPTGWYSVTGRSGCGSNNNWNTWADPSGKGSAHCCKPVTSVSNTYFKTENNKLCSDVGKDPITTSSECKEAAEKLNLTWSNDFNGNGDHPNCLFSNDGRSKVHFNTSSTPGGAQPNYQSLCKNKPANAVSAAAPVAASPAPAGSTECERNDPSKVTGVKYNGGDFPWDGTKSQEWNVNNQKQICEQQLGKCFKNWNAEGKQGPWCYEKISSTSQPNSEVGCAANYGSTTPSDGSNTGTVGAKYVCPESRPVCKDYKFGVNWGTCVPAPVTESKDSCVKVNDLDTANKWVDKLFETLGGTKCADKDKIMAAKTASKTDFISGIIKGYENDREGSNKYYMTAIDKAKPHLEMAFSSNAANEMTSPGVNINETTAPVVNNIAAPNEPVWQDQQMAQQHANQHTNQQNVNQNNGYVMSNNNIVIKGNGECPNGCRAPAYDSDMCQNEIFNGKEYRRCPWVNDSSKDHSCNGCGAILMPKNEYGYAKTRPGLFSDITIDTLAKNVRESNLDENTQPDYLKVGTDFMNDLARVKNFTLPTISNSELKDIGKLVYRYEMDKNQSGEGKLYLTNLINNTLNSQYLPTKNGVLKKNTGRPRSNEIEDRMNSDDVMSNYYNQQEAASDNRLGGSKTAYRQNYRPVDPRKRPNPYDSIWDIFSR